MANIIRTGSDNSDFQHLVVLLDEDLAIRDGEEHGFYDQFNKLTDLPTAVVCYVDNIAIGCGAFKEYELKTVEIKRMYVHSGYRQQGFAFCILKELELWASELHYTACILETGKNQPEAIKLYQKAGYSIITNYGQYSGVENSVCMKKDITKVDETTIR